MTFTRNEPQTIIISIENASGYSIRRENINPGVVSHEFGDWIGDTNTIPATITPHYNGKTSIKYNLINEESGEILDSIKVNITVDVDEFIEWPSIGTDKLAVSQDNITLTSNEPFILYVSVGAGEGVSYQRNSLVDVEWGELNNGIADLTITPIENGTTELKIYLAEDEDTCIIVNVTVDIKMFTSSKTVALEDAYIGATVIYGSYEQDNNLDNGSEPIEWLVLDVKDGKTLLLSKYGIESTVWNSGSSCGYFDGKTRIRVEEYNNFKMVEYSDNMDFYTDAFSTEEQMRICPTSLENGETEYVFLLSKDEVIQYFNADFLADEYGDSENKRVTYATASQNAYKERWKEYTDHLMACGWLLRKTNDSKGEICVSSTGAFRGCKMEETFLGTSGFSLQYGYPEYFLLIRPAMWIEIK